MAPPNQTVDEPLGDTLGVTAREAGLARCDFCGTLHRSAHRSTDRATHRSTHRSVKKELCRKCAAPVHSRKPKSLQRTWAFLLIGLMAYIPANIYPILITSSFSGNSSDTIVSGVVALMHSGNVFIALVILLASVGIPVVKFVVIAGLALSLHFQWTMSEQSRQLLHHIIELIGRWSMIDVFVVAVLAALIQLGAILTIEPGVGINAFALSVVFTMFSATSLDPRLIWDGLDNGS